MKRNMTVVVMVLVVSAVFAGELPQSVKHFADWVPQLEFDSTNDCYVAQYDPAAKLLAYVYRDGPTTEPEIVQPGGTCVIAYGEKAHFTQHARVGCTLTYTNNMAEFNGVELPVEFKNSPRQLLISGRVASRKVRDVFEKYAFVVNAEGEAYDVGAKTKFHLGLPFHSPEDKSSPKLSRGMENIQRKYLEEGVEAYKTVLDEPRVQAMKDSAKGGVTNAVSFVRDMGGMGNLSEKDKNYLIQLNPENALLFAKLEATRWQETYIAFCTSENEAMQIAAVARLGDGPKCRMWSYEGRGQVPTLIYSWACQGRVGSYYEYGDDGLLRNLCLFKDGKISSYNTMLDGVLQKSSDMDKAQAFISRVEEMFNRYVELDTTGTFKPFVEKLKAQAEEAKTHQEAK